MQIGVILTAAALLLGVIAYVARPLFEPSDRHTRWRDNDAVSHTELTSRQEAIVALIRELDADHATGKVNSEDYQALRNRYVTEGVSVLKQLDALSGQNGRAALDERIEAQIKSFRQTGETDGEADVAFCTQCGHAADPTDRFCARCGTTLKRTVAE